ncbi:MAG: hypothetical protein JSS98_06230 [Bacteroidetes bacterium]|nr:hypothetical protein [Bacteroidota bacterium]
MKYFFLFSFILALSISANGQLDKNYWLVGGSGSFYSYNDDFTTTGQPTVSGKLTDINLSANVGYFFFDKFAAGVRPGFYSIKTRIPYTQGGAQTHGTIIYVGPFIRYYLLNKEKQFNILVDGAYQFGSHLQGISDRDKGVIRNASIMTGPVLFFNNSVGIELLVGYLYQKKTLDNPQSGFSSEKKGFNISIGFQIHLIKN